jgi:hypothetical protein
LNGGEVRVEQNEQGVTLSLSQLNRDAHNAIVVLEVGGEVDSNAPAWREVQVSV